MRNLETWATAQKVSSKLVVSVNVKLQLGNCNYKDDSYNWHYINRLTSKLKPHSNGTSYSNTVIGTLAVDGWAVTFGTARKGRRGSSPPMPLLTVQNVTVHPSVASVPTSYYSMWHYNYRRPLKG